MSDSRPELTSVVLTLRPRQSAVLPLGLGRAAQSLLLNWVQEDNPHLAKSLHDDRPIKPYTCSTLWGGRGLSRGQIQVEPERTYRLRFTTLSSELTSSLLSFLSSPPESVELDRHTFVLEGWTVEPAEDAWARQTTYQDLAAPYLLVQKSPSRYVELEFASPTTFRSGGRNVPIPLPDLVFGSLADKWNALSPVAISPEARRYASECMAVASYNLRSRAWPFKNALVVGGTGHCRYVMTVQDRYWMSVVQMLAEWSLFSGVGAQTASGLGQTRRAESKPRQTKGKDKRPDA